MKIFNFIIGIIVFAIINLASSFYVSAFLLQVLNMGSGASWIFYVFVYALLTSLCIFIWHKYIFSNRNEEGVMEEKTTKWRILKIVKFFLKIIFLGIIFLFAGFILSILLNFDCLFSGCENISSNLILWIFGIIFLFYCIYLWWIDFWKVNSEKNSQNNISETENHSK